MYFSHNNVANNNNIAFIYIYIYQYNNFSWFLDLKEKVVFFLFLINKKCVDCLFSYYVYHYMKKKMFSNI